MNQIELRSGGRVKFDKYWNGVLANGNQSLYSVQKGLADAGSFSTAFAGDLPLWTVGQSMPGLTGDFLTAIRAGSIMAKNPLIVAEFKKMNVIPVMQCGAETYDIAGAYPFITVDELKGKKLRASGSWAFLAQRVGAVPVTTQASEMYEALQRGTIDGFMMSLEITVRYNWQEVIKYFTRWDLGASPTQSTQVFNLDTWNKLPDDVKKIIQDIEPETQAKLAITLKDMGGQLVEKATKAGVKFLSASPEERAKVNALAKPIQDDWVAKMDAKKLPGRDVLNFMFDAVAQAQKELKK